MRPSDQQQQVPGSGEGLQPTAEEENLIKYVSFNFQSQQSKLNATFSPSAGDLHGGLAFCFHQTTEGQTATKVPVTMMSSPCAAEA